jgi:uncharacterized repeat protein (TIGR03803 family)
MHILSACGCWLTFSHRYATTTTRKREMPMRFERFSIRLRTSLTIFMLTVLAASAHAATEKVLHSFGGGKDGIHPSCIITDAVGNIYGVTDLAGGLGGGVAFELSPKAGGGWTYKVLYNFNSKAFNSLACLVLDSSGNLYGTSVYGGPDDVGAVFELMPVTAGKWTEKILHTFSNNGKDGYYSVANLILDGSGNLYGTTQMGGTHNDGTVFELTPEAGGKWTEKILHDFSGKDGMNPWEAGVIFDGSGNLYGTTLSGGDLTNCNGIGCGTVFELTPKEGGGWREKVLHRFEGPDGANPAAAVTFDGSGNLYGTTYNGGANNDGVAFELTPKGAGWTEKVLHNFDNNNKDGFNPFSSLILDGAGNVYGVTVVGGTYGYGTAYELMPKAGGTWTEKVLVSFDDTDGASPYTHLNLGAAGDLFGTAANGGRYDEGVVFEIIP